ncbi:MAG: porin [Armatimonadota bacterium]|nr:porin [Armatimonadota bacterium]
MAGLGIMAAAGTAAAAIYPTTFGKGVEVSQNPDQVKAKLDEIQALKDRASSVTKKIGELAAAGNLPTNREGIDTLKALVDELKATNEVLEKVQQDVEAMRKFMQDQQKTNDGMKKDLGELKKIKASFYTQFQWTDTQSEPGASIRGDGFNIRRSRVGLTYSPTESTSAKISFDMSTGGNRVAAELKDLIITHMLSQATSALAGQMTIPLGYELERSSSNREMPERSLYNRRLFAGERDRGVQLRHKLSGGWVAHAGIWSGLTLSDPQQSGFQDQDMKVGVTVGARTDMPNYGYGISAFFGSRPSFTSGGGGVIPESDRTLVYLDGMYAVTKALTARGEVMFGKDRDPLGGATPTFADETNVLGYHVQLSYFASPTSQLTFKYENYDPDVDDEVSTNRAISQIGLAYTYHFNKALKVTLSWEHPDEQGTEQKNDIITIRTQFKI